MTWITTPGRAELLHYGKVRSDDEIEKDGHFTRYREIEYGNERTRWRSRLHCRNREG